MEKSIPKGYSQRCGYFFSFRKNGIGVYKKLLEKSMKNMSLKTNPILSSRESILYWVPEPDKSNGATLFLEVDLMEA